MYLLLLGQLFWMQRPHSWLQTQLGCCLCVSAQPTADKLKVYFNKNLVTCDFAEINIEGLVP